MPVPVSPCKDESSQSASAGTPGAMTIPVQETAQTPGSIEISQNVDSVDPDVVAGYQDCLKETLRFLLEEEQLSMDHPVVMGLAAHLTRDHAHVELSKLSHELTNAVLACAATPSATATEVPTHPQDIFSPLSQSTVTAGFEVTLVEERDDNETLNENQSDCESLEENCDIQDESLDESCDIQDMDDEDYSDSEEAEVADTIMSNPELRRQLLRFVYQGCDLIASPQPISELHQGLIVQL
ncbi:uncharacterized protein [Palaemon carinicauda]|uniref:uncharacterized protein n=1 Tax=Palaemon carinicauda TaxID=392227 RepID=UPI0035B677A5